MVSRIDRIVVSPPGPKSKAVCESEKKWMAPGNLSVWDLAGVAFERGDGVELQDVDGNRYLDLISANGVAALGHGPNKVTKAITEQAEKLSIGNAPTEPRVSLLERIAEVTPKGAGLTKTHLYSGGAEAVESALRLARAYTKKAEVVSFWNGFHGKTHGVLGLMGFELKHGHGTSAAGLTSVPYADCYRCPFKMTYPSCGLHCVEFGRDAIKKQTSGNVAALIVEPIQGATGNVIPPDDFLPAVKSIAKDIDALLISDEMITGFGRSGKMFGCEHSGVQPDIMTVGKALGGGFPVSAVVSTEAITSADPWSRPGFNSTSYGGSPLASAAAYCAVTTIIEDDLVGNADRVGKIFMKALEDFPNKFSFVGQVRGRGLMIALELVSDKVTKKPLSRATCHRLFHESLRRGLLVNAHFPRMRLDPPMIITAEQALECVAILDEVFTLVEASGEWRQ